MSTRQDAQFSLEGESQQMQNKEQDVVNIALQDRVETDQDYVLFKLVDTSRKGRVYIDGIADVVNPQTGKVERARLLAGVDTIWQREQKDIDKDYVKMNRQSLEFVGKVCRIFKWEATKLEFARLNPNNIESPSKKTGGRLEYFEYNPKKQQEQAMKKQMEKLELVFKVRDMPDEEAEKLAAFLGIQFVDELGQRKSPAGIKTELMIKADAQPDVVAKYVGTKEVEISYMIRKAIIDSKIELGNASGNIGWSSGAFICKMPSNRRPLEYLTELAMTNSLDGKQFLEQLQKLNT